MDLRLALILANLLVYVPFQYMLIRIAHEERRRDRRERIAFAVVATVQMSLGVALIAVVVFT